MSVCLLTELQARHFEHQGMLPECANLNTIRKFHGLQETAKSGNHLHISFREAERRVANDQGDGEARWVGGRFMIASNLKRGWNSVRSASVHVMQMTRERSRYRA